MDFKKLEAEVVRILQQATVEATRMNNNPEPLATQKVVDFA
jgi:hypothetical protein